MSRQDSIKEYTLSSGNTCQILRIRKELIPNYYVLVFTNKQDEPSSQEITEMLN